MSCCETAPSTVSAGHGADDHDELESVLASWQAATLQLEQRHAALAAEVERLAGELAERSGELARVRKRDASGPVLAQTAREIRDVLAELRLYLRQLEPRLDGDATSAKMFNNLAAGLAAIESALARGLHAADIPSGNQQ